MSHQPRLKGTIRLYIPEPVFTHTKHYAIHEHTSMGCTGNGIISAPFFHGCHFAGNDLFKERHSVRPRYFNWLLRYVKNQCFLSQAPIFIEVIFTNEDWKITARINAADHFWTIGTLDERGFFKATCTDGDVVFQVGSFLQVAHVLTSDV